MRLWSRLISSCRRGSRSTWCFCAFERSRAWRSWGMLRLGNCWRWGLKARRGIRMEERKRKVRGQRWNKLEKAWKKRIKSKKLLSRLRLKNRSLKLRKRARAKSLRSTQKESNCQKTTKSPMLRTYRLRNLRLKTSTQKKNQSKFKQKNQRSSQLTQKTQEFKYLLYINLSQTLRIKILPRNKKVKPQRKILKVHFTA